MGRLSLGMFGLLTALTLFGFLSNVIKKILKNKKKKKKSFLFTSLFLRITFLLTKCSLKREKLLQAKIEQKIVRT